jgi:putative copper resistance protein D
MEAAVIAARLAGYLAGTALFGAPLFMLYTPGVEPCLAPRLRSWAGAAGLAVALAALAALAVQTGQMAGDPHASLDPATLRDVAFGSPFGLSVLARFAAGVIALAALWAPLRPRARWAACAALGAVALGALAWSGHGAADEGTAGLIHTAADVTHLLAAGVWLGALLSLGLLLLAPDEDEGRLAALAQALKGFSGVGSLAVAAIVASGLANSWFLVGPKHALDFAGAPWGRLLLAKLALFVAMLALAALNRYRLTPRLEASLATAPDPLNALRRSIGLEATLGLAVLALVAWLGVLPPPAAG